MGNWCNTKTKRGLIYIFSHAYCPGQVFKPNSDWLISLLAAIVIGSDLGHLILLDIRQLLLVFSSALHASHMFLHRVLTNLSLFVAYMITSGVTLVTSAI